MACGNDNRRNKKKGKRQIGYLRVRLPDAITRTGNLTASLLLIFRTRDRHAKVDETGMYVGQCTAAQGFMRDDRITDFFQFETISIDRREK
jgi:hypothetical protein